jgi:histidinol-phosphatase (PHP family)
MASGLFSLMAHPDLFANAYLTWDAESEACSRAILEAAADLKIPLEINSYGLRKPALTTAAGKRPMYPWHPFWALAADYSVQVIVNSDAHRPEDVAANMIEALSIVQQYALTLADMQHLTRSIRRHEFYTSQQHLVSTE